MKKEKSAEEMEKDMRQNIDEYVGTTMTIDGGIKCLILGIEESGIRSMPIDSFTNMKKNDLEKCLSEILPAEKIAIAMNEVKKRQNQMNEIYA